MVSIGAMVKQCRGLLDTKDLNERENDFLHSVSVFSRGGEDTGNLSEKQVKWVEDIWRKHFA